MKKPLLLLAFIPALFSCEDDTVETPSTPSAPDTYSFDPMSYDGQITRLDMMEEMSAYMKSANSGSKVSKSEMVAYFTNTGANWSNTELGQSTKNLESKTFADVLPTLYNWMDSLVVSSNSSVAGGPGVAGVVTSNSGAKQYNCSAKGFEYPQLLEKGIMGATFYYQATTIYLGDDKMNVDNTVSDSVKGTDMEHHFDEAFGYWGVPTDFPTNMDGIRFWGKYTNTVDGSLGTNQRLMDYMIDGRFAISQDNMTARDEARTMIKSTWEEVVAGTAIHYLNGAKSDFADHALRNHQLSEAYAFVWSLYFNEDRAITPAQIDQVLATLGDDFYAITTSDIQAAADQLAQIYGWESIQNNL